MLMSNMSRACNGSNCSDEVMMVVYSSSSEKILSLLMFISVLVIGVLGQASVIVTIWRTASLHTQHFAIIVAYCVGDLVVLICHCIMYIWCILARGLPLILCRVLSSISGSSVFATACLVGFMAFERYIFFCYPMKYELLFSKRFLAMGIGGIYSLSFVYGSICEIHPGREFHPAIMACNMDNLRSHTIFQILVFVLPSVIITVFCSVKIWRLSVQTSTAPAVPEGQELVTPKIQAARAFRVILMVSGVFWATSLPVAVTRSVYFNTGITWQDLDSRRSYAQAITLRIIYYLYSLVSPLLNPLIYYYSRKDLRKGLRRVLGMANAIEPQNQ